MFGDPHPGKPLVDIGLDHLFQSVTGMIAELAAVTTMNGDQIGGKLFFYESCIHVFAQ